jgi:cobalt-precorrin 5A hydrolase
MALIAGEPVQIFDPENRLSLKDQEQAGFAIERVHNEHQWTNEYAGVWVTWENKKPDTALNRLILHPKCLVAGVGCNRGTKLQEIIDLIKNTFQKNGLSMKSLRYLTTIEAKKDEPGLNGAAGELDVPLIFFRKFELEAIKAPHPSSVVKKHMGVSSVCEATALLKTGGGRLLIPKTKSLNVTVAVALEN